ncbi:MAG: DUF3108 domain-containing protein [Muribaculaceae bacterium]|nr:DUF3108 domain-containing protein [Muribaculaceae bacterium]
MKAFRCILTVLMMALLGAITASAFSPGNEVLKYKVLYKWGLIHKQAGTATLTLRASGAGYKAVATAKSAPWADKFYKLRDTLYTDMQRNFAPVRYERIAHEDGKYSHDLLTFTHSGNTVKAHCQRWRQKKNETTPSYATLDLSAQGMTVDLFSSFYYLRSLPFGTMNPGTTHRINIFSGKKKELLTFTYSGLTTLKLDGKEYQTYKVKFTFTSDGKKQTSDPIEAWVSTDASHIPLKLVGKLKIGQVQCIYTGS